MTQPNFLVIGAAKSGTTSLHRYLAQHPQVFMSEKKELNYFAVGDAIDAETMEFDDQGWRSYSAVLERAIGSREAYEAQFAAVGAERAIGESSPRYLYTPRSAEAIHRYRADMKLVVILRDPVDRAFSHYRQNRRKGFDQSSSFSDAIDAEDHDESRPWVGFPHYLRMGRYHGQLEQYRRHFPDEQIFVCLHRDLVVDPAGVMRDVFTFLGVDPAVGVDVDERHNAGADDPRYMALHRALLRVDRLARHTRVGKWIKRAMPTALTEAGARLKRRIRRANVDDETGRRGPTPADRRQVASILGDDIEQLGELLDRDLSHWVDPPAD